MAYTWPWQGGEGEWFSDDESSQLLEPNSVTRDDYEASLQKMTKCGRNVDERQDDTMEAHQRRQK